MCENISFRDAASKMSGRNLNPDCEWSCNPCSHHWACVTGSERLCGAGSNPVAHVSWRDVHRFAYWHVPLWGLMKPSGEALQFHGTTKTVSFIPHGSVNLCVHATSPFQHWKACSLSEGFFTGISFPQEKLQQYRWSSWSTGNLKSFHQFKFVLMFLYPFLIVWGFISHKDIVIEY